VILQFRYIIKNR